MMQRRSVWEIEKERLALEQQIAAARHHAAKISGGAGGTSLSSEDAEAMAFDWTKILSQLAGSGDHRELTRLISRLAGMTVGEINSALDEIGQLDLPTESRDLLAKILLPSLVAKDPEAAPDRFPLYGPDGGRRIE
jgi:hypothetical protein